MTDSSERDKLIAQSDEHWRVLADRYGLSRSSVYRIRRNHQPEPFSDDGKPNLRRGQRQLLFSQTAVSGLTRHGGVVEEEFQRELQEDGGAKLYTEMATHPVVAAVLFAIRMGGRRVRWYVEAASDSPKDKEAAEFVEQCRDDMAQSWDEVDSQIYTMLKFGFSLCELVYKLRLGQKPRKYIADPARSRFDDGKTGWRRWQFIAPTSLSPGNQWEFDQYGRVQAINQTAPPVYKPQRIGIEKLLLFRTSTEFDNPEGRALPRPMYKPWYYADNLGEVEAIGAERMGTGFPVIYLGRDCSLSGANSDYEYAIDAVRNVRVDEQMGLVLPGPKMGSGAPEGEGWLFELVSPPSRGLIDFDQIITRYEQRMAMSTLAQFIFLGMAKVGTQALAGTLTDFFVQAVGAWSDSIADIINRFAIPRLMALNPFNLEELPRLRHSELDVPNLAMVADYINRLVGAQVIAPYPALEQHLLEIADLPPKAAPTLRGAEAPEEFALRLKRGGPKWERATNDYQRELQDIWADWAEQTARELATIEDEAEREERLEEAVAAVVTLLVLAGRENLPRALDLGLAGGAASPDGLRELAEAMLENERYLEESLGPAVRRKVTATTAEDPSIVADALSLGALFGMFSARVGLYAGAFWATVMRGFLDRLRQRPDAERVGVRWVLDARAQHCPDCLRLAGEYENYDAMVAETGGLLPGAGVQCDGNCRCHLEFKVPGKGWGRW